MFSNVRSHRSYGGADIFLMPSMFEPCGLSQMIAMTYGTIPIVREPGGLKDTVMPFNEYTGEGNGFSFYPYNKNDMMHVIRMALKAFANKEVWAPMMKRAMKTDFSWNASAKKYSELYDNLLK